MLKLIAAAFGIGLAFSSMVLSWYILNPKDREKTQK